MPGAFEQLSGKLGLDTTDFKTAIQSANRELRVLESGFKASAAALGDWTQDATGLESRIKSLTGQIDIQKSKVAALAEEHQRLVQEHGEGSRAAQEAEIKLNKETETLNKMQVELQGTEGALQEMTEGEQEAGEAAQFMGEKIDGSQTILAALGGAVGIAVTALAALGAAAIGAVSAITDLVLSAAEAGSELQDMSDKTGISTQRLQELSFIGNQVGTSLDTITGAQARLIRSMDTAAEQQAKFDEQLANGVMEDEIKVPVEMAAAFNGLGVAFVDAGGNLRDNQAVFTDLIDALGRIQNPAERDALAMQIFGKSAQELNPLIKLGAQGMAEMTEQAHELGAVMSDESVAALDAFDDMLSGLKDGLKGTLGTLATAFLPVFQKLATVFQGQIMPVIQRFIAIVSGNLAPVIQQIVDLIDVFASGDIRGGLAQLFGADNADAIINLANIVRDFIQNTLIPFFTAHAGEISSALQDIVGAIISVATIITELAIAWTKAWFMMHDIMSSIWGGFLQPIFEALRQWLATTIPAALQFLTNTWTGVLLPAIQAVWGFIEGSLFPLFQAIAEFINAVFNLVLRVMAGLWQNVVLPALQAVYGYLNANVFPIFRTIGDYISTTFKPILDNLASFLRTNLVPAFDRISNAIAVAIDWIRGMADAINNLELPTWLTPGSPTPWELGLIGINKAMRELNQHIPQMAIGLDRVGFAGSSVVGGLSPQTTSQSVQNDQFQFFAPVIVQGEMTPGGFGSAVKGKRF
jgi:hypothetical protein